MQFLYSMRRSLYDLLAVAISLGFLVLCSPVQAAGPLPPTNNVFTITTHPTNQIFPCIPFPITIEQTGTDFQNGNFYNRRVEIRLRVEKPDADRSIRFFTSNYRPRVVPIHMNNLNTHTSTGALMITQPGHITGSSRTDDPFMKWRFLDANYDTWSFYYTFSAADKNKIAFSLIVPGPHDRPPSDFIKAMLIQVIEWDTADKLYAPAANAVAIATTNIHLQMPRSRNWQYGPFWNRETYYYHQGAWVVEPWSSVLPHSPDLFTGQLGPDGTYHTVQINRIAPANPSYGGLQTWNQLDDFGNWQTIKAPPTNYNRCEIKNFRPSLNGNDLNWDWFVTIPISRTEAIPRLHVQMMPINPDGGGMSWSHTPIWMAMDVQNRSTANANWNNLRPPQHANGGNGWRIIDTSAFSTTSNASTNILSLRTHAVGTMALLVTDDYDDWFRQNFPYNPNYPFHRWAISDVGGGNFRYPTPTASYPFTVKPRSLRITNVRSPDTNANVPFSSTLPSPLNGTNSSMGIVPAGRNLQFVAGPQDGNWEFGAEIVPKRIRLVTGIISPTPHQIVTGTTFSSNFSTPGTLTKSLIPGPGEPFVNTTPVQYHDAGFISVSPQLENNDYLGAGDLQYKQTYYLGRFVPASYSISLHTTPVLQTSGCTTGNQPFSYIGQPLSWHTKPQLLITPRSQNGTAMRHVTTGSGPGIYANHSQIFNRLEADNFQQIFVASRKNPHNNTVSPDPDLSKAFTTATYQNDSQGRLIATLDFDPAFPPAGLRFTRPQWAKFNADNQTAVTPNDLGSRASGTTANRGEFDALIGLLITGKPSGTRLFSDTQLNNSATEPSLTPYRDFPHQPATFPHNNLAFAAALQDADGISQTSPVLVATPTVGNSLAFSHSPRMRMGRLFMPEVAQGIRNKPTPIPLVAQYFDDATNSWRVNTDENCLTLNIGHFNCATTTNSPYGASPARLAFSPQLTNSPLTRQLNQGRAELYLVPPDTLPNSTHARQALRVRLNAGTALHNTSDSVGNLCRRVANGQTNAAAAFLNAPWLLNIFPPQVPLGLEPGKTELDKFSAGGLSNPGAASDYNPSTLVIFSNTGVRK